MAGLCKDGNEPPGSLKTNSRRVHKVSFSGAVFRNRTKFNGKIYWKVHRCGASGSMRACHAAGPGSIPGRDRFPG